MKYMDIGCIINCWKCKQDCPIRDVMILSCKVPFLEELFYAMVIDSLKPMAGQLIAQGKNSQYVHEDLKLLAVSFYVARKKVMESLTKK